MDVARSSGAAVAPPVESVAEPVGLVVLPEPLKDGGAIGKSPCPGWPAGPWLFEDGRLASDPVAEPDAPPVLPGVSQDGSAIVRLPEPVDAPVGPVDWAPFAVLLGPRVWPAAFKEGMAVVGPPDMACCPPLHA